MAYVGETGKMSGSTEGPIEGTSDGPAFDKIFAEKMGLTDLIPGPNTNGFEVVEPSPYAGVLPPRLGIEPELATTGAFGSPTREIYPDPDNFSDEQIAEWVDAHLAGSDNPMLHTLYAPTHPNSIGEAWVEEGWSASKEMVSEVVQQVVDEVKGFLEGGDDAIWSVDVKMLKTHVNTLARISYIQDRLGISELPQGQLIGIASGVVNIATQSLAGAMGDPVEGRAHLSDVFDTLDGMPQVLLDVDGGSLKNLSTAVYNVEVLNQDMILHEGPLEQNDPQLGFLTREEIDAMPPAVRAVFDVLIDPDSRRLEPRPPEANREIVDYAQGPEVPGPLADGVVDFDLPEMPSIAEPNVLEEGAPSYFGRNLDDADGGSVDEPEPKPRVEVASAPPEEEPAEVKPMGGEGGEIIPWYEAPVSERMMELESLAEGVSYIYNTDVERAEAEALGEDEVVIGKDGEIVPDPVGLLDPRTANAFTSFLEELSGGLTHISVEEATVLPGILAPLLMDLGQGLIVLEDAGWPGLSGSELFGVTQIMADVIGSVYSAAVLIQDNPGSKYFEDHAMRLLETIQPIISDLAEGFGEISDILAEPRQPNTDSLIRRYLESAKDDATDVFNIVSGIEASNDDT